MFRVRVLLPTARSQNRIRRAGFAGSWETFTSLPFGRFARLAITAETVDLISIGLSSRARGSRPGNRDRLAGKMLNWFLRRWLGAMMRPLIRPLHRERDGACNYVFCPPRWPNVKAKRLGVVRTGCSGNWWLEREVGDCPRIRFLLAESFRFSRAMILFVSLRAITATRGLSCDCYNTLYTLCCKVAIDFVTSEQWRYVCSCRFFWTRWRSMNQPMLKWENFPAIFFKFAERGSELWIVITVITFAHLSTFFCKIFMITLHSPWLKIFYLIRIFMHICGRLLGQDWTLIASSPITLWLF